MAELPDQIAELEAEIERLAEAAAMGLKIALVSELAAAIGGLALVAMILGVLRFSPEILILAIAAVLGGLALTGTNRSTVDEIRGKIVEAEKRRSALIDALRLRAVEPA